MRSYGFKLMLVLLVLGPFLQFELVFAGDRRETISFSKSDLSFEKSTGYDMIKLRGAHLINISGEPALPVKNIYVALSGDVQVSRIELVSSHVQEISGKYRIFPAQPPVPTGIDIKPGPFIPSKVEIYNSSQPYPQDIIKYVGTGWMGGQKIAILQVLPVQYLPSLGVVKFYDRIEFNLTTQTVTPSLPAVHRTQKAQSTYDQMLKDLVINPQDVGLYNYNRLPAGNDIEYLIITSAELASSFQPLAEWKTRKGIPSAIRTTSWIGANYPGRDLPEKIRNYIKTAYQDSGTVWVLLGGDTDILPCRYVHIDFETLSEDIPSDLYYSDLDGSWDYDNDGMFGEPEDSLDMFPDVFVGRAPVIDVQGAERFVNKVATYSITPTSGYQLKGLFLASYWDSNSDAAIAKNMIIDRYIPEGFGPVCRLYQSLGNLNATAARDSLNQGFNIVNHCGHSNYNVMSTGPDYLYNSHFDNLINAPKFTGVLFSTGCWSTAIDYPCIAESFVNSPGGGGFFIGNSRYGWYTPYFPGYGSGELFDQAFFSAIFPKQEPRLGAAVASSQLLYAADAHQVNDYRWICFELILLGDPEMSLWTDEPKTLSVDYPDTIVVSENQFEVSVKNQDQPVNNALVCISKGNEVYASGLTGADGQVSFTILPATPGSLLVTVTASNYLPYQDQAAVVSNNPLLTLGGFTIDDDSGNQDGIINPGEKIGLKVNLINSGNQTAFGVVGSISTSSPQVDSIEIAQASYGDLAPGNSAAGDFSFQVSPSAMDRDVICFNLHATASGGFSWNPQVALTVGAPKVVCLKTKVDDGPGGDGMVDPNETVNLEITVKNLGLGISHGTNGTLSTLDPYIDILSDSSWFGDLASGDSANSGTTYQLKVSGSCPDNYMTWLFLSLFGENYSAIDSMLFFVGDVGFYDDVENGAGGWTHTGTTDEWHITTHRSNSETHSWYCGRENVWLYSSGYRGYLVSPSIVLAYNSQLYFWTWYFIQSGFDYAFCEINAGEGWREQGLITGQSEGWVKKTYDLSGYAGDTVQIRFTFFSDYDNDQYEGWYIDDIEITPHRPTFTRGDCNRDGAIDIGDVVYLINYLYKSGPVPNPLASGDANRDSVVDVGDVVYLINYLFKSGPPPNRPLTYGG
jgi:hypothetical protein